MIRGLARSAFIPVAAAWLAVSASVTYQLLLVVLIFLRPELDPSWHTISEWAIGPHGWLMLVTFFVSAISYLSLTAVLMPQASTRKGWIGLALLLLCAAGVAGAGLFTTDPMPIRPPLSTRGTLHVVFGTSQLVLLPLAALLVGLDLARPNGAVKQNERLPLSIAWLPLFGFLSFAVYTIVFVMPLGSEAYGPGVNIGWPPRVAFFTYSVWTIVIASHFLRAGRFTFADHTAPARSYLSATGSVSQSQV